MKRHKISKNVVRRLPRYLRKLDELINLDVERVSSNELGAQMGLTPSQIRQDFSNFGEFGQQGYGYNIKALRSEIASILGMDRSFSIILVGVGNIGHTLIDHFNFARYGFKFLGSFDIRKDLVGSEIKNCPTPIMDVETQEEFISQNNVDIAILSVSREKAQAATDRLVKAGIKAIWNFTDTTIDVGDSGVKVEDIYFSDSLLALSYLLLEDND